MTSARRSLALGSLAVALAALALAVASRLEVERPRAYDLDLVPRADALRWASLGHPTLIANLWWLRAVQYIGEPEGDARGWDKLHPVVDLVTDLDPRHGYAYQVGGNILSTVGRVAESNALLEKGARNVPDRYILPFHRAVNAFLFEGDYALAGRWFERAAGTPGASPHVKDYAAAMYVKGRAPDAAIAFLSHLYAQAEDDDSRRGIRRQLDQVVLERDAALLEEAAAIYRERVGFPPIALHQLVHAGLVPSIPPDPFGGEYHLDADGRVRSSAHPRRFERPLSDAERRQKLAVPQAQIRTLQDRQETPRP